MEWTRELVDILIEKWKLRPELYKEMNTSYANILKKKRICGEIAREMGIPCGGDEIMRKMKSLRTQFLKVKRDERAFQKNTAASSEIAKPYKVWPRFTSLLFLDKGHLPVVPVPSPSNLKVPEVSEVIHKVEHRREYEEFEEMELQSHEPQQEIQTTLFSVISPETQHTPEPSVHMHSRTVEEVEETVLQKLMSVLENITRQREELSNTKAAEDEADLYGRFIASVYRTMSRQQRALMALRIQNVIYEIQCGQLSAPVLASTSIQ